MPSIHQVANRGYRSKKNHNSSIRSLERCPQRKGVVVKVRVVTPKKPNSARRKVARIRLSNGFMVTTKIKGIGHNLQSYSTVLVCGGRANDLPGVRYNLVKGALDFGWKEDFMRRKSRSKYGIPADAYDNV